MRTRKLISYAILIEFILLAVTFYFKINHLPYASAVITAAIAISSIVLIGLVILFNFRTS